MTCHCPACNHHPCQSGGCDRRNNFLQLLLISLIEAVIVSVISSATSHMHHQHPNVEIIPHTGTPMCPIPTAQGEFLDR